MELSRRRHQLTQKPTARWSEGEFYLKIYIRVGCSFISTSQPPHYHKKATATAAAASQSSSLGRVTLTPPSLLLRKKFFTTLLYSILFIFILVLHYNCDVSCAREDFFIIPFCCYFIKACDVSTHSLDLVTELPPPPTLTDLMPYWRRTN